MIEYSYGCSSQCNKKHERRLVIGKVLAKMVIISGVVTVHMETQSNQLKKKKG